MEQELELGWVPGAEREHFVVPEEERELGVVWGPEAGQEWGDVGVSGVEREREDVLGPGREREREYVWGLEAEREWECV